MTFCCWVKSILKIEINTNSIIYNQLNTRHLKISPGHIQAFVTNYHPGPEIISHQISHFDSDSFEISVDNCASRCMTNQIDHFITPPEPLRVQQQTVQGINKDIPLEVKGEGTIQWKIEDDNGQVHSHQIRKALYVPALPFCLLSPQHWAQSANDNFPKKHGTVCTTNEKEVILIWKQLQYTRTIRLDPATNTARFRSAPGAIKYRIFDAASILNSRTEQNEHVCYQSTHMGGYQDSVFQNEGNATHTPNAEYDLGSTPLNQLSMLQEPVPNRHQSDQAIEENISDFAGADLQPPRNIFKDENDSLAADDVQAELLRWHHRLGHLSFIKIRLMALLDILPRRLSTVKPPKCAGCIYGAMNKRPWRTKSLQSKREIFKAKIPGDCVSVDLLESTTPGFIAQLKGGLTKQRYRAATVFVDHASRLGYVFLQKSLTSAETVQAKQAFEAFALSHGVSIKHYHCDNGRFADNEFIQAITESKQTISYSGVNAHFQNGIAEKRIRDLQERARKQLLHAKSRWPSAIELNLWPYALRNANHLMATLPDNEDGSCPLERFTGSNVSPCIKSNHTFGCPVYALQNRLQTNGKLPKWNPRARVGIYLGPSPRHASSISLVLNINTGLVSPQFHVSHDDFFETVRPSTGNPPIHSLWQQLSGFQKKNKTQLPSSEGGILLEGTRDSDRAETSDSLSQEIENEPAANPDADGNIQDPPEVTMAHLNISKYGRQRRVTTRMQESQEQRSNNLVAYSAYYEVLHEEDYQMQEDMSDPIAFLASTNADTMYFDQAMRQPDKDEFVKAIVQEVNAHIDRNHWELIPRSQVPKGNDILPAVWSMKRKRDIKTRQVYKWKARLNVHGGKQKFGINYFETYSPVVNWFSIRLMLVLSILNKWHTRQVDFIQAYPQADIEYDLYMELPKGIQTKHGDGKTHVLKLLKNLYGQKQAGRVWSQHLSQGLKDIGFEPSNVDECVFYRGKVIFLVYVDDGIFISPDQEGINKAIMDLQSRNFDIEDQGQLTDYLGVNVEQLSDGRIKLSQPHLIDEIICDMNLSPRSSDKSTPAASTQILHRDSAAPPFENKFNYRSVIGKLNFLEKSTCPDISYAVHQCARFSSDPRITHGEAVIRIARYLKSRQKEGLILDPHTSKSIEVYADADFSGNWNKLTASEDPSTSKSRTGFIITFANCPITWSSKLQTQVALSSTEAEYVALSQSLREAIPIMQLLEELKNRKIHIYSTEPKVYCKAFEDNSGALEISRLPKIRPRTKHINLKYHHFREFVRLGKIHVYPISTKDQIADLLTKPLAQNDFLKLRKKILHF